MECRIIQPRFRKHFRIRVEPPPPYCAEHNIRYFPVTRVKTKGDIVVTKITFGTDRLIDLPDYYPDIQSGRGKVVRIYDGEYYPVYEAGDPDDAPSGDVYGYLCDVVGVSDVVVKSEKATLTFGFSDVEVDYH